MHQSKSPPMSSLARMLRTLLLIVSLLQMTEKTASHSSSVGPHITDVNILLPPKMTYPVEYLLQGTDGCFKWSWDHHDILSVLPEYNLSSQCSTGARLRSIAPFHGRKETAVYATDLKTGIVIRCKVFIDNISRIRIFHNSVKLDLDGLATLRVRGFDEEDNIFSSLVGLQFMWRLMPETDGLAHHLIHVPLKDSPLSDCGGLCGDLNIQINLEDSGVFSDLYAVKGIGIGHESVSVHLLEPEFEYMGDKILLTVAEAMSLEPPSPVFVIIGAAFQYTLKVIRGNVPQGVTLPSPHHRWSVSNSSVAEVDSMIGFTHALSLGVSSVIVEDIRVAGHMQMSSLIVVLPDSLCLYLTPLSISGDPLEGTGAIPSVAHWYVVSGRQYLIQMKVFSQGTDAQEIYITENDDLKLHDYPSEHWTTSLPPEDIVVKHGWQNSRILRATSQGQEQLTASLTYFSVHQQTKEVLKVVQEIIVCDKVKFNLDRMVDASRTILLPWTPAVYQEVELKATGGCGRSSSDYKWFSSDMAALSISASGVIRAKKPGKATVRVVSIFDSFNYDEVVVEVSVPSSMLMLQNFPVETVVGSHLQAAVTMKASNGASFYKCDAFYSSIKWKTGSESFIVVNVLDEPLILEKLGLFELQSTVYGSPCSWTYVYASGSGQTMLHATLSEERHLPDYSNYGPIIFQASSRIAAYLPLTVHQVSDGNQFGGYGLDHVKGSNLVENLETLYLIPGASVDVALHGGPEKWGRGVDYIETVEILDEKRALIEDGVHVHLVSCRNQSMYRVSCHTLGTFTSIFKRGNLIGDDHPVPAIAEVTLSPICSFPSSIVLIADEPVNKRDVIRSMALADHSLGQTHVTPVTVANGRTIRIAAVGIGSNGEAFANSSSLSLKWELTNCEGLAYWDDTYELKSSKSSWERYLVLRNETGLCVVRATVFGFVDTVGSIRSAQLQSSQKVLTDAIRLQLVSALRVNPEFNLLIFNPNAKVNLSITGGTCFLEVAANNSQVVEVIQSPEALQCSQLILSPKGLGTAVVTIYDIGLAPPISASAVVQVADVDWIKIVSEEEISLMEGQLQSIDILAGINDGNTFDFSQYIYMKILVYIEDNIVELVDNENIPIRGNGYVSAQNFKIVAKQLGITTLYVGARQQSGNEIFSQPMKVEVFAPLKLHPHNIFLVPGAMYMLSVNGGPTAGVHVEYASMDDTVATVDISSGRLTAISPGNTTIISTIYGKRDVAICQAYGSVKVGVPSSAKLNVQSEQLDIGREMSIYPSFSQGDLFSFYELCKLYKWTIDDEEVLSFYVAENLHGMKHLFPLDDVKELGLIRVLYGRSAGKANVTVTFSCDFVSTSYSQSRLYDASISLSVVPDLPLARGVPITWVLPPNYVTSGLLPLSLDAHSHWDSRHSGKGTITYTLLKSCVEKNEAWERDAISIEGTRIKTKESNNVACIQANDRTTGKIGIASCIRVAEVAQIRVRNKDYPFHIIYLAIGAEVDLPISYFDTLGNPFYEVHNVISFHAETNFHDIVGIDDTTHGNGNIHLKAMRHGRALVRVSLNSNPEKSDYILISVGANLYPQNPVIHQGSSLNFSVEGINDQVSGNWHSANESVIYVDVSSGKAKAVGIGSSQVFFECPTMRLQTAVVVLSGNIISVDAPKEIMTNVPYPTNGYSFTVKLRDTHNKYESVGNSNRVSYDCKVDPPFVGYAKAWMDIDLGNFYCLFFPYSPEHLVHSVPKSKDIRPYIPVTITASLREAKNVSGSASALFVGGFSILGMDKSSMQLNLTPEHNKTFITILGNTDVEIQWDNQDLNLLKISPISKEDFGIAGRLRYEVKMLREKKLSDRITIRLPATGQRAEINVNYEPGATTSTSKPFVGLSFWVIIGGTVIVVGVVAMLIRMALDVTVSPRPPTSPATPNTTAPVTPERINPSVLTEGSPRTPPPFVDYVRRTIDETPYYRREARRRFNPQNTY